MKVFKVKLYQELVNYRKAYSYNFLETYPLPSFSMIKGWIYSSIDAEDKDAYYEETITDLKIGVSGVISGLTHDLQHMIKLGNMNNFEEIKEDLKNRTPTYVTLISSINLNIYIHAGERLLNDFQKNLFRIYPSLGRYEDLAQIEFSDYIELAEKKFSARNSHPVNYYTYLSEENIKGLDSMKGSYLRIPTTYEINNKIRNFKKKNVLCLSDNCTVSEGTFFFDNSDSNDERVVDLISLM